MSLQQRFRAATKAAVLHFSCSLVIAALAAGLVFGLWYPFPYRELSGGRELFLLVVAVDVVCGPLLTAVLFNPKKPRAELVRDLGMVALIQLGALGYGLWTVWEARPLFLVQEVDRFKVVNAPALEAAALQSLDEMLKPKFWGGPKVVAIRKPKDVAEKNMVLFSALNGGRDYGERPDFYIPYAGDAALQSLQKAVPLALFLERYPEHSEEAKKIAMASGVPPEKLVYLPVVGRQEWVAILNDKAAIIGFLKGDGF